MRACVCLCVHVRVCAQMCNTSVGPLLWINSHSVCVCSKYTIVCLCVCVCVCSEYACMRACMCLCVGVCANVQYLSW